MLIEAFSPLSKDFFILSKAFKFLSKDSNAKLIFPLPSPPLASVYQLSMPDNGGVLEAFILLANKTLEISNLAEIYNTFWTWNKKCGIRCITTVKWMGIQLNREIQIWIQGRSYWWRQLFDMRSFYCASDTADTPLKQTQSISFA